MSLDELLVSADVVSLHVPLSDSSRHLVDRRTLARMRRSAYLINTSRGPVVDEEALVWALSEHLIAGAALDVYEREPAVHPGLLPLENVVLAPHIGSATRETRFAMAELAVKNAAAVLAGQPPLTPVPFHPLARDGEGTSSASGRGSRAAADRAPSPRACDPRDGGAGRREDQRRQPRGSVSGADRHDAVGADAGSR